MMTFNPLCEDCKYYSDGNCNHPDEMYCENCSLWWGKDGEGDG